MELVRHGRAASISGERTRRLRPTRAGVARSKSTAIPTSARDGPALRCGRGCSSRSRGGSNRIAANPSPGHSLRVAPLAQVSSCTPIWWQLPAAARVVELPTLDVGRPAGEEVVAAAVVEVQVRVDDDVDVDAVKVERPETAVNPNTSTCAKRLRTRPTLGARPARGRGRRSGRPGLPGRRRDGRGRAGDRLRPARRL